MRFGCCAGLEKMAAVEEAGYDFIELPVKTVMPESPDAEFAPVKREILAGGIVPEAWNCLLPGDLKITGPDADLYRARRFVKTAFQRIADVGGEVVVFGSGGARRVPEGYPMDKARKQILDFLASCAEAGAEYGVTVAIEPLNSKESNIINSVPEAVGFADALGAAGVRVLADFYHIDEDKQPFEDIIAAGWNLAHVHTADTGRRYPGSGSYDYDGFFSALRQIGYDARISVECIFGDFESEARAALEFLQAKWQEAVVTP